MQVTEPQGSGTAGIIVALVVNLASTALATILALLWARIKSQLTVIRRRVLLLPLAIFTALWFAGSLGALLLGRVTDALWPSLLLLTLISIPCSIGLGRPLVRFWSVGVAAVDVRMKSGLTPQEALESVNSRFRFLGTGASKLTSQSEAFAKAVARCNSSGNTVQLLLSKPDAENLAKSAKRVGKPSQEYREGVTRSLRKIAEVRRDRDADIEVRFYDGLTLFRLMLINDRTCVFSYNVYGTPDETDFPQLFLARNSANEVRSYYWGFSAYFDQQWERAQPWDFVEYL